MKKVLVAMSGGVDSSVAAIVLKSRGYYVSGATMLLSDNLQDVKDAKSVCDAIGIEHFVLDRRSEFEMLVKRPFAESYLNGETPNPCVVCNKHVKFGLFLDFALENGFDFIATGHYVNRDTVNGIHVIKCAEDKKKDQSYVLWQLSKEQIERSLFPLCNMDKSEVRRIAEEHRFISAHKSDSQDICFVPDKDYAKYITESTNVFQAEGEFIDTNGTVLGKHSGIINYTVGQRKGLGIAFGEPRYVISKNIKNNTVTLGKNEELFSKTVVLREINISEAFEFPGRYDVKIRYAHAAQPATVVVGENGSATVEFDEPQRAPAPGQSAVIYKGDLLVGGGVIT